MMNERWDHMKDKFRRDNNWDLISYDFDKV
jgi:hypothetical protein